MLRNDNGGEYKSNGFNIFCQNHGIQCQFTTPHTLQQNRIWERKNMTLIGQFSLCFSILSYQSLIGGKHY